MKYSIIIPYRDREEHLSKLLPRLQELFSDKTYEIIIAEQDDNDKFQKNSLYNIAALKAKGALLVFHDVDYYPTDNVSYFTDEFTPLYPVRQVIFLDQNDQPLNDDLVPEGYRFFKHDVKDHSGGVFVLSKNLFLKIEGFNPYYKGWGKEDDDTRDKLRLLGYNWKRNNKGLFYALHHENNHPSFEDKDFINNHYLLNNLQNNLHLGYNHVTANVKEFELEENIKWLKVNNFKYKPIQ
jgi:predicted glycosyltransferase involved in capsule biosynthesis